MTDGIINGTGDSRKLKSSIPAGTTWEQALAMLNAGTFPIDLAGINAAGWQQIATALNKANLLSDQTATLYGLGADATPNNVLEKIHPFTQLVFEKIADVTLSSDAPQVDFENLGLENYRFIKGIFLPFSSVRTPISIRFNDNTSLTKYLEEYTYFNYDSAKTGYTNISSHTTSSIGYITVGDTNQISSDTDSPRAFLEIEIYNVPNFYKLVKSNHVYNTDGKKTYHYFRSGVYKSVSDINKISISNIYSGESYYFKTNSRFILLGVK